MRCVERWRKYPYSWRTYTCRWPSYCAIVDNQRDRAGTDSNEPVASLDPTLLRKVYQLLAHEPHHYGINEKRPHVAMRTYARFSARPTISNYATWKVCFIGRLTYVLYVLITRMSITSIFFQKWTTILLVCNHHVCRSCAIDIAALEWMIAQCHVHFVDEELCPTRLLTIKTCKLERIIWE